MALCLLVQSLNAVREGAGRNMQNHEGNGATLKAAFDGPRTASMPGYDLAQTEVETTTSSPTVKRQGT